jgi:hypothetical protein
MKVVTWSSLAASFLLLVGCEKAEGPKAETTGRQPAGAAGKQADEAEIAANLAKLGPEERKLAEDQKFCAVLNDSRLGSMGVPVKVVLKDEPVFLCCKGCVKKAQSNPDQTLARAKELRSKTSSPPER